MDDHVVLYRKTESPTHSESKLSTFRKRSSSQPITSLIPPNLSAEKCPSSLTFAIRLPGVYTHAGITRPLPPSYSARFGDGIPGMFLRTVIRVDLIVSFYSSNFI